MQKSRFIFDTIEFEEEHLFEFSVGRHYHHRQIVYSYDADEYLDVEVRTPDTTLAQVYPLGRNKLFYLFDWGDSWIFEIRRANRRKKVEPGVTYPRIIDSIGENPEQYPGWE